MATEPVGGRAQGVGSGLRLHLWDGVLPEALGLCFVAIIFGGFTTAYFTTVYFWRQQGAALRSSDAETLTRALATTLGVVAEADEQGAETEREARASVSENLLAGFTQTAPVHSVRWSTPEGTVRFAWPSDVNASLSLSATPPRTAGPATGGDGTAVATAPVRTPTGKPAGTLRIETNASGYPEWPAYLLWTWGIAAAVTLLVFTVVYHRLRRHLRPMAAIERNLQSYAGGIEKELTALTLSDSLGSVARSWNLLLEHLGELQRQQHAAAQTGPARDVLARFESTVFRRLVDRLPFGVLCVRGDHHISYANASAAALLRRPPEQLVGVSVNDAVGDPAIAQALVGVQTRGGVGSAIDQTWQDGDQEATLRFRVLPISDQPRGGEALVTVEDIGQLREDQRARDNFLYHVTHELRTPLTSIHAYVETLTKPGFDDEQTRKECYNVIISETRRLSALVENILSISQLEVGTARLDVGDVDLVRLIRQMVQDNLGAADEKHIDLTLKLPPKAPKIRGDKQRLAVLLTNLLGNAIKYTAEQGKVQVTVAVGEQCVQMAVSDTGVGIAPEDQAHVFEKFYRAADERVQMVTGTGLGLAIAREVARLHGGEIRLQSELGKGSTFTVELPLPTADPQEVSTR
jgi:signal transduction histidine kinase